MPVVRPAGIVRSALVRFPDALRGRLRFDVAAAQRPWSERGPQWGGANAGDVDGGSEDLWAELDSHDGGGLPGFGPQHESWQEVVDDSNQGSLASDSPEDIQQELGLHQHKRWSNSYGESQIINAKLGRVGGAGYQAAVQAEQEYLNATALSDKAQLAAYQARQDMVAAVAQAALNPTPANVESADEAKAAFRAATVLADAAQDRVHEAWQNYAGIMNFRIKTPNPEGGDSRPSAPRGRRAQHAFMQQLAAKLNRFAPILETTHGGGVSPRGAMRNLADPGWIHPREGGTSHTAPTESIPYIRRMGDPPPGYYVHGTT